MPSVSANGVELYYEFRGPEGAPVVAFSNSLGTTLEMWDAQARALTGRFRVLRYDTRGHGRSQVVDHAARIEDLARDFADLLDGLAIAKAHVVGLSLGGMTAQQLAVSRPELVDSLTLMATSAYLPQGWDERATLVRAEGMQAIVDAVMARWFTPGAPPASVASIRERFLAIDKRGYAACCAAIRDMDLRDSNRKIVAPTLLLAGADDPATPPVMMEAMRGTIPGAELIVLPRAAHILAIERADRVNAHLLGFLESAPERRGDAGSGATFAAGLANRKQVLGAAHVQRSLDKSGGFAAPWQDFITRTAWGEIWGDPALPWKTRSLLTLTMMAALHREEEFKLHLKPALGNGVSISELRAMLLQSAIYAGVPAANAAFRWARETLGGELDAANTQSPDPPAEAPA